MKGFIQACKLNKKKFEKKIMVLVEGQIEKFSKNFFQKVFPFFVILERFPSLALVLCENGRRWAEVFTKSRRGPGRVLPNPTFFSWGLAYVRKCLEKFRSNSRQICYLCTLYYSKRGLVSESNIRREGWPTNFTRGRDQGGPRNPITFFFTFWSFFVDQVYFWIRN